MGGKNSKGHVIWNINKNVSENNPWYNKHVKPWLDPQDPLRSLPPVNEEWVNVFNKNEEERRQLIIKGGNIAKRYGFRRPRKPVTRPQTNLNLPITKATPKPRAKSIGGKHKYTKKKPTKRKTTKRKTKKKKTTKKKTTKRKKRTTRKKPRSKSKTRRKR